MYISRFSEGNEIATYKVELEFESQYMTYGIPVVDVRLNERNEELIEFRSTFKRLKDYV